MRKNALNRGEQKIANQRALLAALSDDLALPLLQIKTTLEVLEHDNYPAQAVADKAQAMTLSAEIGLQMVEAYRLALASDAEIESHLEPVSIGAVLNDVAAELNPYAKQYMTDLHVDVQGKFTPVLAHRPSLMAALQCLGASLIRAQASYTQQPKYELVFGAHRGHENAITTGAFSNIHLLSDRTLRAARSLAGHARQPLASMPAGAASGVLIADLLCTSMWQPLRPAAHRKWGGLATAIPVSRQLQFV